LNLILPLQLILVFEVDLVGTNVVEPHHAGIAKASAWQNVGSHGLRGPVG
jgi:hypothetical protein